MNSRWLLDTSAFSRRHIPAVADALRRRVDDGEQLCLAAPTLLELIRTPRGGDVEREHATLREAFEVVALSEQTGEVAASAMIRLAANSVDGHRLPIADLLTAALAAEHGLGVLHIDKHFDQLSAAAGLAFPSAQVCHGDELQTVQLTSTATRQRELHRALNALLSRLAVDEAERLLATFASQAQAAVEGLEPS